MKEIFDYIESNSFLTTIIGVLIGGMISSITAIYISNREIKARRKDEYAKEKQRQYQNKPELKIVEVLEKSDNKPDIEVFLSPFEVKYSEKAFNMIYPTGICDRKKHRYKEFRIRNIGKTDINQLDVCATFKNHNALCSYEDLNRMVKNGFVDYDYCYDRKIMQNEEFILRVYYLENYQMCHPFSCTLALLFKDSNRNLWEQPFWYEKDNLYEPRMITYQEYRLYVTMEDALDCFEHPWKW